MHGCSVAVSLGGWSTQRSGHPVSAQWLFPTLETVYGTGMYFWRFQNDFSDDDGPSSGRPLTAPGDAPNPAMRFPNSLAPSPWCLGLTSVSALTGEGKEEGSKAQGRDFLNRYRSDKVGGRKDGLRARGPHYVWLLNRDLGISDAHESRFRCLLLKEREKLKTLFNRSEDGGIGAILDIRIYLAELAKQAQLKTAEECAIT